MLAGLTNKYNIWASTLDKADVDVMHERIENGANLLQEHCFQFDFLNDDFDRLPKKLQAIIKDEEKRKKLIIYINPPYAEADNRRGEGRSGVAESMKHKKYANSMGYSRREIYLQFFTRIYQELKCCKLCEFADTFDNVKGKFPIGFKIWNLEKEEAFEKITAEVYDKNKNFIGTKIIQSYDNARFINN